MEWIRGETIGKGSFGTVNLAILQNHQEQQELPYFMAVKSALLSQSSSLQHEKSILTHFKTCPQILSCFGDDLTDEDGHQLYNLFLEYVPGGNLSDLLRRSGGSLLEPVVRRYACSILLGLRQIHAEGYVHCDIKLNNILVCSGRNVKIADFGLAKKAGEKVDGGEYCSLRGTPLYMSPESVSRAEYEAPADVWSFGCAVAEMISGKPAWRQFNDRDVWGILYRVGFGDELPEIPSELSEQGKDFLSRCFVKDPSKRWTAEMLLNHPFIASENIVEGNEDEDDVPSSIDKKTSFVPPSPRSILDLNPFPSMCSTSMDWLTPDRCIGGPSDRIRHLITGLGPNWSSSSSSTGNWIAVRRAETEASNEKAEETVRDPLLILDAMVIRDEWRWGNPEQGTKELEFAASTGAVDTIQLVLPSLNPDQGCRNLGVLVSTHCLEDGLCLAALRNEGEEISRCRVGSSFNSNGCGLGSAYWLNISSFCTCSSQVCCNAQSDSKEYNNRDFCCYILPLICVTCSMSLSISTKWRSCLKTLKRLGSPYRPL